MTRFTKTETYTLTTNGGVHVKIERLPSNEIRITLKDRQHEQVFADFTQTELRELREEVLFDLWVLPPRTTEGAQHLDMRADGQLVADTEKDF